MYSREVQSRTAAVSGPDAGVRGAVRPASRSDAEVLARLLAEAFHDDPLTRWLFSDQERRARILPDFFRVFLDVSYAYDGVSTTENRDAVLLFLPPGSWAEVEERGDELQQRFTTVIGDDIGALMTIVRLQAEHHPVHRPHYYTSFGAVRPSAQRRGLMTALIGDVVARADAEGCGVYAEASSPGGEASCRRFGFTRLGRDIVLPGGGPSLLPLWRDPQ